MSKQLLWERRLLDLSLRNNLLNLRVTKNLLPILSADPCALEDRLSGGANFQITAGYDIIAKQYPQELNFSNLHKMEFYRELLDDKKQLYTPLPELELQFALRSLYRAAKLSIEENGANTLYLALGLMKWFEPKVEDKPRYAPLILVPMEMVRRSFATGYIVRQRDEDVMVNTTLLEMLKQDFGIKIEGLDPIPEDENGIHTEKILSIFANAITSQKNWEILPSSYLGIFSFSQFVLWNDLRNRADELAQNKLVKSLMDGKLSWDAESMDSTRKISSGDTFLPIPTDASQLFAIQSAVEGKSFVLHGPPGTGKSQTITGIIANALAHGKTVLFVAEKMAALSVVQNRMEKLGLGDFCLELHSNKARKKDVLHQLMSASERISSHDPEEYLNSANRQEDLRKELDAYADALQKIRGNGFSFYDLLTMYETFKDAPTIRMEDKTIDMLNRENFLRDLQSIGELRAMVESLGDLASDPLRLIALQNFDLSYDYRQNIPPLAEKYRLAAEALGTRCQPLSDKIRREILSFSDIKELFELVQAFVLWQDLPREWASLLHEKNAEEIFSNISKMAEHAHRAKILREQLGARWNEDLFEQNARNFYTAWQEACNKGVLFGYFAKQKVLKSLTPFAKQAIVAENLGKDLDMLVSQNTEQAEFEKSASSLQQSIGFPDKREQTDWEKMAYLAVQAQNTRKLLYENNISDVHAVYEDLANGGFDVADFSRAYEDFIKAKAALHAVLPMKESIAEPYFPLQIAFAQTLANKTDYIREWAQLNAKLQEIAVLGLESFAQDIFVLDPADLITAYQKTVAEKLLLKTLQEDPTLANFSDATFSEKIDRFKQQNKILQEQTKQEIFHRLISRLPNFTKEAARSSELGILQKAIRSGGRGVSIRKLFQQIPNILPKLAPCMLMSPISCAQYLDTGDHFDLVIFDEASQLPTAKAVGVLARGKEAIIVGDPNQMPPTSFFSGDRADEEHLEEEDLESILQDCLALSMPQTHLLWHYRSEHESLIAFSNRHFYENKLYTFPSIDDRQKRVRFIDSNGIFDRGASRTNPIEAQQVVDEVIRRAKDPLLSKQSIGIVTFNISQQSLIEDLLEKAYAEDPQLDTLLNQSDEPIFVKNLENVQGDERDVILFSVGFGKDKEGKVYMNFGPLNQEGGWRRLNVAITRSRSEMIVFSSLKPEDIDLAKTQARGVVALKDFLNYAKNGMLTQKNHSEASAAQGIAESIRQFLQEQGYRVQTEVGHSRFKIDLAVLDPNDNERYLLGIMLDGENYRAARTTEDREISPFGVLKRLGWHIHRIRSLAYYQNPKKEQDKLLEILHMIQNGKIIKDLSAFDDPPQKTSSSENPTTSNVPIDTQHIGRSNHSAENFSDKVPEHGQKAHSAANFPEKEPADQKDPDSLLTEKTFSEKSKTEIIAQNYQTAELKTLEYTSAKFTDNKNLPTIEKYLLQILEAEAPICEEHLYKKLIKSFGINRPSAEVRSVFLWMLRYINPKTSICRGRQFFWNSDQNPNRYDRVRFADKENKREIEWIHPQELQNAILLVLDEQIAIPQDALLKEACKKLGYTRLTNGIAEHLEKELEELIVNDQVEEHQQMMRRKE